MINLFKAYKRYRSHELSVRQSLLALKGLLPSWLFYDYSVSGLINTVRTTLRKVK